MSANVTLETAALGIAQFYQTNQSAMNGTIQSLASGYRVNGPNDDPAAYAQINCMQSEASGLTQIQSDMVDGSSLLQVAQAAGTAVYSDLANMQNLLTSYYAAGTTADQQAVDADQFQGLQNQVETTINTTDYNGQQVITANGGAPLWGAMLDPNDPSQQFDISYDPTDIADVSGLTLGVSGQAAETAALNAQIQSATSYLAKTSNYTDMLNDQSTLVSENLSTYDQAISNEQDVNQGAALTTLSTQSICQQSALSLLAQANTDRLSLTSTLLQNI
jgi:flagellin